MKSLKNIFSLIMCFILLVAAVSFSACGGTEDDEDIEEPLSFVYADYEKKAPDFKEWTPDFQVVKVVEYAGAIYVNKDKTFVSTGSQSLEFRPLGSYANDDNPRFIFPISSELFEFDYRDLRSIEKITFDFYNAEDYDISIKIGLTPKLNAIDDTTFIGAQKFDLVANSWTKVEYSVDAEVIGFMYDITSIAGFYVEFPNSHTREEDEAPRIYMDNVVFNRYIVTPSVGKEMTLGRMEYLDFEQPQQSALLIINGPNRFIPQCGILKASDIGLEAPSGEYIYKIAFSPSTETGSWTSIITSDIIIQKTILSKLTQSEMEQLVLSFWGYNDTDTEDYMEFNCFSGYAAVKSVAVMQPRKWTKFSISVKQLLEAMPLFAENGTIRFVKMEYTDNVNKVFYIDNICFEWAADLYAKPQITDSEVA